MSFIFSKKFQVGGLSMAFANYTLHSLTGTSVDIKDGLNPILYGTDMT